MTRLVKATYHSNIKVAEFVAEDGRHLLRSGGSLQWRINNGGDLVSPVINGTPAPKRTQGYIGFAKGSESGNYFFIFPDYETGRAELRASLLRKYAEKSIKAMAAAYAPKNDGNDPEAYAEKLAKQVGVNTDVKVGDLKDAQFNELLNAIERWEGYHADSETRREVWINVSQIMASDGIRPLAGEEIVVRRDGQEATLRSDSAGMFPPIVHGKTPIEVIHRTVEGEHKSLATLPADKSHTLSLVTKLTEFFGVTGPVKPERLPNGRRHALHYTVQPHDTLSKIASKFKIDLARLKQDNGLLKDAIFPGQVLGIHGPPPQILSPATTKRAAAKAAAAVAEKTQPTMQVRKPVNGQSVTLPARSKDGQGEALALIPVEESVAPWMKYAIGEAKHFKGAKEDQIEKERNYAKEVKTGQTTIVGSNHPWCAAFVNWCLMKAGYPIDNETYFDHVAAKGRAHAFFEVQGQKAGSNDKKAPVVRNPLFAQIDKPVYGAIAMVTSRSGHGHHVGFVYARQDDKTLVLLGGNQGDQINFSPFHVNGKSDSLRYFVPVAYLEASKRAGELPSGGATELNKALGIVVDSERAGSVL